jgi:hypothetical protein
MGKRIGLRWKEWVRWCCSCGCFEMYIFFASIQLYVGRVGDVPCSFREKTSNKNTNSLGSRFGNDTQKRKGANHRPRTVIYVFCLLISIGITITVWSFTIQKRCFYDRDSRLSPALPPDWPLYSSRLRFIRVCIAPLLRRITVGSWSFSG